MLADERRIGMREGIKKGKLEGIREGKLEGIREGKLEGIKEGKLEGIKEGIKERNYAIAKGMKNDGADFNLISKYTGLSIKEIEKL